MRGIDSSARFRCRYDAGFVAYGGLRYSTLEDDFDEVETESLRARVLPD